MNLQKVIDQYKNIALSDKEVLKLVEGRANIILYPELHNYSSIDEILEPYGACFLLYEAQPHFGHWCCLLKTHDKKGPLIEFFDPYGGFPDSQRRYIPELFRKLSHQDVPHLSYLLLKSPYELSYNQYHFQKMKKGVRDCGRWCALRIILRDVPLDQFAYLFNNRYSDDLATILTI